VRRKRSRLTLPPRLYSAAAEDSKVSLELGKVDVYQELPPDNIALPLEVESDTSVWVRRAVYVAVDDRQPIQIHVSWMAGLDDGKQAELQDVDPSSSWPGGRRG
jgi:hypothetical protein